MSASFAGSRSVDERRRRRLAADADDAQRVSGNVPSEPVARSAGQSAGSRSASRFPLRKLISPRLWKLWSVAALGSAAAAAILWASINYADYADVLGPGFARLFNPGSGRAVDCCLGLILMITGELALLIWWVRSRSPEDFAGSYRKWTWMAAACFAAAIAAMTDGHLAASETILWMASLDFANASRLSWMAPAFLCGAVILSSVRRDMRGCRSSVALLWLSSFAWIAAGVFALRGPLPALSMEWNLGLCPALVMFASLSLFTSLLLHARHVMYETADPPKSAGSSRTATRGRSGLFGLLGARRGAEDSSKSRSSVDKAGSAETPRSKRGVVAAKPERPAPAKADPVPSAKAASATAATSKQTQALASGKKQEGTAKRRVDMVRDKNSLKGLSKRERRMVRKQWREEERAREDRE